MSKDKRRANRARRFGTKEHRNALGVPPVRRRRYVCADPRCPEQGPHFHYPEEEQDDDAG